MPKMKAPHVLDDRIPVGHTANLVRKHISVERETFVAQSVALNHSEGHSLAVLMA